MTYQIRPVNADEWSQVKELRLAALADPAAPVAFLDTLEWAAERPDSHWQERTKDASLGGSTRQFIAEDAEGRWAGTVVVLVERAGEDDFFGNPVHTPQAQLVNVFVRPEHRGGGLTERLFRAGMEWAWSLEEPLVGRVRLFVHKNNPRAAGFYRKFGFIPTGHVIDSDHEMEIARA
ncbi:GNAT family N-acetyltransferase [Streptomyces iconiensis]|uniref:GNAT family N-acetyltransferase n=1 Tax=Streptomyces iconiensis TaxID=1384038 RepID=A0ABT6ZPJ8_9ACTN|nr:GNAT family N-acetyltransferase [Streptomyces iconiensis]MDJ1130987.1 GNAT family N-acetyltransferase [Streptomyces iconiensis]